MVRVHRMFLQLCIRAVVGATYPEMGKVLRKIMPESLHPGAGLWRPGGQGKDLVHFFNEDGLGAIINSSRGHCGI